LTIDIHDIPYGERNIWGATAGMLMTLRGRLMLPQPQARVVRPT